MEEKLIVMVALTAVVSVGLVGVIGVMTGLTGASQLSDRFCECTVQNFDFSGNPSGGSSVQYLRVRSSAQYTDSYCDNACKQHFGPLSNYPNVVVTGKVAPLGTSITIPGDPYA